MRIVEANPYFLPHLGGIENRMHVTSKHFAELGHDVTVLTAQLPGTPREEDTEYGYRILRVPSRFYNIYNPPYVTSKGVIEALESLKPDIVNYNYRWAFSFDGDVSKYGGKKVFTYHNMWGEGTGIVGKFSEINDNSFRKTLDTFDHIICVSDYVKYDLIRRGIPEDRLTTIPTCLDLPEAKAVPEGDFILSLGRLVATKGLDSLIDAMPDVDCRLILCGKGPEEKNLRKRVARLGLEDRVEFRGYVSEEEKNNLMRACRLFVMPSIFESFGLAALEVLGYGRPLVYGNVNGLPDTVGAAGIPVTPGNPKEIAAGINRLLSDAALRKDLGVKARAQAEKYTWGRYIPELERVLSRGME